ncbi:MAG: hypothetical protein ACK55I_35525, partial [bacterium]
MAPAPRCRCRPLRRALLDRRRRPGPRPRPPATLRPSPPAGACSDGGGPFRDLSAAAAPRPTTGTRRRRARRSGCARAGRTSLDPPPAGWTGACRRDEHRQAQRQRDRQPRALGPLKRGRRGLLAQEQAVAHLPRGVAW